MISLNSARSLLVTMLYLGPADVLRYARHRANLRLGLYRRDGAWRPQGADLALRGGLFATPPLGAIRAVMAAPAAVIADGRRVVNDEIRYFHDAWWRRPPNWQASVHGRITDPSAHWTSLGEFSPEAGDVKWLWEPSRFAWAVDLVRAYAASGDGAFVEKFWSMLDDWRRHNPPHQGINWRCGQECSLRLVTLVWTDQVLAAAPESTPLRRRQLAETVAALAERIALTTGYAVAQKNNHALSEGLALYLAGASLENQHVKAGDWRRRGRSLFEGQLARQVATDGSYIQNSFIYARLALQLGVIFVDVATRLAEPPDTTTTAKLEALSRFMYELQDPVTGRLPNYGANDGTHFLALASGDYDDFRPTLQLAARSLTGRPLYPRGPHDEASLWLLGNFEDRDEPPPARARLFLARAGGYYGIRGARWHGMLRCHTHKDRPSHADMLHFDLWRDGTNVLIDAGTYSYNDPQRLGETLKGTAAHNCVVIDDLDQMTPFRRFLWLDWTKSRLLAAEEIVRPDGAYHIIAGEHYAYARRFDVVVRRSIIERDDDWLIVDDLIFGDGTSRSVKLHWHLDGAGDWQNDGKSLQSTALQCQLAVVTSPDVQLSFSLSDHDSPERLRVHSREYGRLRPRLQAAWETRSAQSLRLVTAIGRRGELTRSAATASWKGLRIPLTMATQRGHASTLHPSAFFHS